MRNSEEVRRGGHAASIRQRALMRSIGIEPRPYSGFCVEHHQYVQYEPGEYGMETPCGPGCRSPDIAPEEAKAIGDEREAISRATATPGQETDAESGRCSGRTRNPRERAGQIGHGPMALGALESVAESTAGANSSP